VHYQEQPWGVFHYAVLYVLPEVTVGHINCGTLHMTKYVFPDAGIAWQLSEIDGYFSGRSSGKQGKYEGIKHHIEELSNKDENQEEG